MMRRNRKALRKKLSDYKRDARLLHRRPLHVFERAAYAANFRRSEVQLILVELNFLFMLLNDPRRWFLGDSIEFFWLY